MVLRSIGFAAFAFIVCFGTAETVEAQSVQSASIQISQDAIDARAFAGLFRRENVYLKMTKNASSTDTPEAHLAEAIPNKYQLDAMQSVSLQRVASDWANEIAPIRSQMNDEIKSSAAHFQMGG